jgi:hypothetical protein
MPIQSVIFNKKFWTIRSASKWLLDHKLKVLKIDDTKNYYRFRQLTPDYKKEFYTLNLNNNVKLIIMR